MRMLIIVMILIMKMVIIVLIMIIVLIVFFVINLMITTMIITTMIITSMMIITTTMVLRSNSFLPFHSSALFSVDPLTSVRRSFQVKIIIIIITIIIIVITITINIIMIMMILQDIQAGVGRSMRSLMAAGSAIGHRMLGMITRAPSIIVILRRCLNHDHNDYDQLKVVVLRGPRLLVSHILTLFQSVEQPPSLK